MFCSCLNAFLQIGQSPFRGRGIRGGRTFRRGGRGQFRHQGPPFRGQGRGRGGASRQIPAHSSAPTNSIVAYPPAVDGATSAVQPSSPAPGQIPIPTPAQVPAALAQPPPRVRLGVKFVRLSAIHLKSWSNIRMENNIKKKFSST